MGIDSLGVLLRACGDGAMDMINLKISRFGGLTGSRLIRDLCASLGIAMTIEDSWGGEIATAATAHLAHSTPGAVHFHSSAYGVGGLRLTPEGTQAGIETDLATAMAAFGGRGVLSVRSGRAGAFELAVVSDALVTNTVSESTANLMGAAGQTSRLRLMLEGSGSMPVAGGVLRPTLEAGLRVDGGDAETGAGLEVGAGLGYAAGQFAVEVNARALLAHEDTEYEGMGLQRFDPLPAPHGRARVVDEARIGLGTDRQRRSVAERRKR